TGTYVDNTISQGAALTFPPATGKYAIGANGLGYIANPLFPSTNLIFGSVAQGIFTGSDTEDVNVNDIFIAIPIGTSPTNAGFTGGYSAGVLDFAGASSTSVKNALFNLNPDGQGGLATLTVAGQAANQNPANVTQTITGGTYNFMSGNASLN